MFAFVTTPLTRSSFNTGTAIKTISYRRTFRARQSITPRAQLIGVPDSLRGNLEPSPHEVLLAELRYSDPSRLPALVEASLDLLDEDFYKFLEKTINESSDLEERETLRTLRDAITSIMGQMLENMSEIEKQKAQQSDEKSDLKSAQSPEDIAQASYDELIDQLLNTFKNIPDDADETQRKTAIKSSVDFNYHRIDLRMLERLSERIVSAGNEAPLLASLRDSISEVMNERVTAAMTSLKTVLSAGPPQAMRTTMDKLARQGAVDDAFILLMQANVEEAKKAGATQAVEVMSDLLQHATDLKDMMVDPEIRLIRTLLRTEDEQARHDLLMESFEGGGSVMLADESKTMGTKVDGKKFVTALRKLIEEFGHVDEKFVLKLSKIGEESEAVARKIFDMEGKDVKALQDEAFHKRTVSVWDLEEYEHQETGEGRTAPWEGRLGQIPEKMGFGPDGKLSV